MPTSKSLEMTESYKQMLTMSKGAALAGSAHKGLIGLAGPEPKFFSKAWKAENLGRGKKYFQRSREFDRLHRKQIEAEEKGEPPQMLNFRGHLGDGMSCCSDWNYILKHGPSPMDPRFLMRVPDSICRSAINADRYVLGVLDLSEYSWPPGGDRKFHYKFTFTPEWDGKGFTSTTGAESSGSNMSGVVASAFGSGGSPKPSMQKEKSTSSVMKTATKQAAPMKSSKKVLKKKSS
eukprot:gnl/TRDRNA2_/TRDRNA2_57730_c0_seq1.p1 gnl/TRDRNA2_/TRDRNA2_57730_c0~~gnl/TRDRNA2_/TRDRNA2_57730_c0_seq1.p1  ORF type:complete len:234 (-),score=40.73 gnl/TRDRNA2_/TRDRNA2_57730_c0_seq1:323-1024(-)